MALLCPGELDRPNRQVFRSEQQSPICQYGDGFDAAARWLDTLRSALTSRLLRVFS